MKHVVIIILLLFGASLNGFSQPVSVDSIIAFYKDADIECYKEIINNGMKSFDKWLADTFPKNTILHSSYSVSDIDLREHNAIPIVALKYYNMDNISEYDDIYEHLIIDSTKCMILVPYDEENKPLGITDILGETYSYLSFRNKEDMHYYGDKAKHVKKYLKMCRKVVPDALVFIDNLYAKFGYVKDGKIMLVKYKQRRPIELNEFVKEICKHPESLDLFRKSDQIYLPESERERCDSKDAVKNSYRLTGKTPKEKIRICESKGQGTLILRSDRIYQ